MRRRARGRLELDVTLGLGAFGERGRARAKVRRASVGDDRHGGRGDFGRRPRLVLNPNLGRGGDDVEVFPDFVCLDADVDFFDGIEVGRLDGGGLEIRRVRRWHC